MQIGVDSKLLQTIFRHATTAVRLAGCIDDQTIVDGLVAGNELAELVRDQMHDCRAPRQGDSRQVERVAHLVGVTGRRSESARLE
ncbi:MAG TPA: hypothetical protein VF469_06015 [Kofleriaceae bacterium]